MAWHPNDCLTTWLAPPCRYVMNDHKGCGSPCNRQLGIGRCHMLRPPKDAMSKALTLITPLARNTSIEGRMCLTMVAWSTPMPTHKSTQHMIPNSKANSKRNCSNKSQMHNPFETMLIYEFGVGWMKSLEASKVIWNLLSLWKAKLEMNPKAWNKKLSPYFEVILESILSP